MSNINIKLIVGLGNPGPDYSATRHNAGIWWLDGLCYQHNITLQPQTKFHGLAGKTTLDSNGIYCLSPTTYMNESGRSIAAIANYYKIPAKEILIAHDDLDLIPGTLRLKTGGGHGGHNGLRDIIPQLGSKDFHRLRIGIGHPGSKDDVSDYVLTKPSKVDAQLIKNAIDDSLSMITDIVTGNWQVAMNYLHDSTK